MATDTSTYTVQDVQIRIIEADPYKSPAGKLADVELTFPVGLLEGYKLTGFALWEARNGSDVPNVTFPARQYQVNGERRAFALVRPADGLPITGRVEEQRNLVPAIREAWTAHKAARLTLPVRKPATSTADEELPF